MILVNGSMGIGTGFSTDIPPFSPEDIIRYIKYKLDPDASIQPSISMYYRGFIGKIDKTTDNKYIIRGCYTVSGNVVHVTELPIGMWTDNYKEHLEKLIQGDDKKKGSLVKEYIDMSTDVVIDIKITLHKDVVSEYSKKIDENNVTGLEKLLKLTTTKTITNMHAFDENERLVKYNTPEEMIDSYIPVRLGVYEKRKAAMLANMKNELVRLSNKARFISGMLDDTIDLRRKSSQQIYDLLAKLKYDIISNDPTYAYLVKMPMDSLTSENVDKLIRSKDNLQNEIIKLEGRNCTDIWNDELDELLSKYRMFVDITPEKTQIKKKKIKTNS